LRLLDLRQIIRVVLLSLAGYAYACGGAERTFIDDYGTGGQGGSSGGDSNDASSTGGGGMGGSSGAGGRAGEDASSVLDVRVGDARGGDASDARGNDMDAADMGEMQPPPPPGRPGLDSTAGGMWMQSTNFRLFAATGETPGYNGLYTSPSFRLRTGVISTTQR